MGATKAKAAWEILQQEFQGDSKIKLENNLISTDPIASFRENEVQPPSHNPQLEYPVEAKCENDEFWPLSGKPYFNVILSSSQVKPSYHLSLPAKVHRVLPFATVPAIVSYCGKNWTTVFRGESSVKRFESSTWKRFVIDNDLKIGDALVFELMESSYARLKFRVQILRGDFPAELLQKVSGKTRETATPINDD